MNILQKNDCKMLVFALVIYGIIMGLTSAGMLSAFWQLNLIFAGLNIILAASLNLINGYTGQFSLGHAGFMAVGAYVGVVLTTNFGMTFPLAILVGGIAAGLLGALIGLPTLRLRGDYLAIATLGLGEIVRIFIIKNFVNSRHGRACLAIRENEIAAESMGVNTTKYKVLAFTIGAFFAGIAGVLFGHNMYILSPASFTFMQSFNILIMVVMGGLGSMTGSIAGALVVTFLSAALASFPNARMIIYALALILLMFYRPQGLFGYVEVTAMQPLRRFFKKGGKA